MICISHIKKQIKNHFFLSILISTMLIFSSCENIFSARENSPASNSGDKTYLTISLSKLKNTKPSASASGRTVYPDEISVSQLNGFILKGAFENDVEQELFTAEDSSAFSDKTLEILPGNWTFTLTASFSDTATSSNIVYSDSVNYEIKRGVKNLISFELKPQLSGNGGFEITINLADENKLDKVRATLTSLSGTVIETKDLEIDSSNPTPLTYSKANITDENGGLEPGSYHLLFEFLAAKVANPSSSPDDWILVNQWESYVCIIAQKISTADLNLDFNELYTISYQNADGSPITDFYEGVAITKYSPGSTFPLPRAKIDGKVFLGWKKQGGNDYISEIESALNENLILIAEFADPVLYVSESGDDDKNGFSSSTSLKTITEACNQIIKYGYTGLDWKIMISGETTGIPTGSGKFPAYGPLEIPSDITNEMAKSILITGATPHGNWLEGSVPDDLDSINRGSDGAYNGSATSSALVISTEVPVTITNLKITGGNTGNGGAILINEGATVSLGDGNLLTGNRASKGGAICNKGTLFIYGSTIIGNKDATTYASYSSTQDLADNDSANYAGSGGGIYNGDPSASTYANTSIVARLYLGYKPSETDLTPVKEEFTGGIYFNGASSGGGIRNAIKSEVYMNSGTIQYNGISGNGAGIYNDDGGIVYMSGGSIANNRATYNSSIVNGGGVYNDWWRSKFIMSGGSIFDNIAWCNSGGTTNGKGGGVFNGGVMFMYGTAVIGDSSSNSPADSANHSNKANMGGGIYNGDHSGDRPGKLYIGYEPDSEFTPVPSKLEGGIFYNYSEQVYSLDNKWGGGGIFNNANSGYGEFRMSSGTIAYNATNDYGGGLWNEIGSLCQEGDGELKIHDNTAAKAGNAIYIEANSRHYLTLGGSLEIPKGQNDYHDIYIGGTSSTYYSHIEIASDLDSGFEAIITPEKYIENIPLVSEASGATINLEAETQCFSVTPQTKDDAGEPLTSPVNWEIDSTGKLKVASSSSGVTITRTNPEASLTPTSGTLIFEVTGLSNPEEPWTEVNVDIQYFYSEEDCWCTYDADEGHNWSSDWEDNLFKLYLYSFSPDDRYKVAFYDSDNSPLCDDYEFEFTVAELPVQTINIGSLDSDGLSSAVQSAVEIFGGGKVKLAFTGTNDTDGVNLYSIVANALASYQAAEIDFSECSGNVVSEVPDNAFWNKFSGNGAITLSNSTTKIGKQAFAQNSTITVSNLTNVTEIGEKAFYGNSTYSGIDDISLDSVTSIGNAAFGNCVIGTLYLGTNTNITIDENAFYDSESSWNPNSTKIGELNIGNFEGDVKTPFNKCYRLSKFVVPDTNTVYYTDSEGSKLYLKSDDSEYMSTK